MVEYEITIIELKSEQGKRFKVTRRMPIFAIAETKFFDSQEKAKEQLEVWLREASNL